MLLWVSSWSLRAVIARSRELISSLQHEEKNAHQAQEDDATRTVEILGTIERRLTDQRDIAVEYHPDWSDFLSGYRLSVESLNQAQHVVKDIVVRAKRSQHESHTRIMLRQIARNEYVPARTPIDIVSSLRDSLGTASTIQIIDFNVPKVLLDWNLMWHGLNNGISNARKHGSRSDIKITVQYQSAKERLVIQLSNGVDTEKQIKTIEIHGEDGTHLLHRRADGSSALSSNIGGKALLGVMHLLNGSVSLRFAPAETTLRVEVEAPEPKTRNRTSDESRLIVYFLDDEATMRRRYLAWITPPFDSESRVVPKIGLSPQESDAAVLEFSHLVLNADPRPRACLLDQNLKSQVNRFENVTTGSEIATTLRKGGYEGTIIIRSANVSRSAMQEYLEAGADAVMSKDEQREVLLRKLLDHSEKARSLETSPEELENLGTIPLLDKSDFVWTEMDQQSRKEIIDEFRVQSKHTLSNLEELLYNDKLHALPGELHCLVGQCRAIGATRLQSYVSRMKQGFTRDNLTVLELVLKDTLFSMDKAASTKAGSSTAPSDFDESSFTSGSMMADSFKTLFASVSKTKPLVCVGLDDSTVAQHSHQALFETVLKADMQQSKVGGSTQLEQDSFIDIALGRVNGSSLVEVAADARRHADIALVDQNIRLDDVPRLLGTTIAAELKMKGFSGVCAILTGTSADSAEFRRSVTSQSNPELVVLSSLQRRVYCPILRHRLQTMPGVDLVISKGEQLRKIASALVKTLCAKRKAMGLEDPPTPTVFSSVSVLDGMQATKAAPNSDSDPSNSRGIQPVRRQMCVCCSVAKRA
jgi:CheY-like chemotaxis protein